MRLLQHWLHGRILIWAWHRGPHRVGLPWVFARLFSPWSDPAFLRAGVPLVQLSRHVVVTTDVSKIGWDAVCNRHAALGSWTGPRLQWHINWRVASSTARSSPVLTVAAGQACTGLDGQHSDGGIYQPPGRCTLPSHVTTRPLSPPL